MRIFLTRTFRNTFNRKIWEGDWPAFCDEVLFSSRDGHPHPALPNIYPPNPMPKGWTPKDGHPAFIPAQAFPEMEDAPKMLANKDIEQVWLAIYDHDDVPRDEYRKILEKLKGIEYCSYTTWNHRSKALDEEAVPTVRARTVIHLSRPVAVADWKRFWRTLRYILSGGVPEDEDETVDTSCKNPSRAYVRPYSPAPEEGWVYVSEGAPMDVDKVLTVKLPERRGRPKGQHSTLVARLRRLVKRLHDQDKTDLAIAVEALAEGRPYAEPGKRHNDMLPLTACLERVFSQVPIERLAELFQRSLTAMAADDFDVATEYEAVVKALQGARDYRTAEATEKASEQLIDLGRTEPYSPEELESFAVALGTSVDQLKNRWIIQHKTVFHILINAEKVEYQAPVIGDALVTAAKRDLSPALSAGVTLDKLTQHGMKPKTRAELMSDYGSVALGCEISFFEPEVLYDPKKKILYRHLFPHRTSAQHSPDVERWLRAFAGSDYPVLERWLSLAVDLAEPLVALNLMGPGGAGKSLLAEGLARIWGTAGTLKAEDATQTYNECMQFSPIVFADERLPTAWSGAGGGGALRQFVQMRNRSFNKKYEPVVHMVGCHRVILAANNEYLVKFAEELTEMDRAAIAERILFFKVRPEAVACLAAIRHPERFIHEDLVARHVLWLRETVKAEREGRFGLVVQYDEFHQRMKEDQPINSAVGEWLIGNIVDRQKWLQISRGDEHLVKAVLDQPEPVLRVNVKALSNQARWECYVSSPRFVPSRRILSNALVEWGIEVYRYRDLRYQEIPIATLVAFADRTGIASPAEIHNALHGDKWMQRGRAA